MSNWKTAKQYVQDYKDGLMVGSAERENAQYLDSIAGKWNVIKENMKAAGNTIITSDMVKGFLDVGIVLSEGFNKGIQGLSKGVSSVLKGNVFTDIESSISDNLYRAFEKINLGNKFQGILDGLFGDISIFDGFGNKLATSLSNSIGKAFSFAFSQTSMGKALKPIMDMLNVDGLFEGKKLDNQIDSRNENINAIKSEINGLKNQKQAIEDILPSYDELSKKTKLSASESQQLAEMRNQLADSNPDLVLGYDQNGTPILKNLQAQNKQLESQIKLKQQSQRLEENSLALDTLQKQTLGQKEFNKAYKEYNDMQLASNTKRKEGLFGKESTQDYAKRIIDDNKKITEANQKAYEQRLKDHQQYVQDERAIQQKYMNEMTQKSSFNKMSEEMKSGMLTFMDALDWSKFSPSEGNQFAGMLANLGDKLVPTTEAMGKQSKAIAQLTQDYADGKTNLINYTKGLTEQYEAAGKFDAESFSAWRQGLQSYVDTTGDLQGANKAINEMATSLNKITGIKTDTWKTALSFDPAPIDASNKALQKFLNSYGTGVQNMGKGGIADKLTSQFETLQNSYTQMTSDLASGKTIDVEYLVNAKVNQPEPIASLIDEIVADNKVTEQEIDLLLTAQAEILNTGEISDETIKQIADEFNMTEEEVRLMLNVKTEVKEEGQPLEEVKSKWESIDIGEKILSLVQKVTGGELVESAKSTWDSMNIGEKIQTLIQMVTGGDLLGSAAQLFAGINVGQKIQELLQKVTGSDLVKSAGQWFNSLSVGQKIQELLQKVSGGDLLKSAASFFTSLNVGQKIQELLQRATGSDLLKSAASFFSGIFQGTKNQTLEQKATGSEAVKEASNAMQSLPSVKEVTISFIQSGKGLLDSISGFFKSKTEEKISVSVQVTGKEQVESVKDAISSMQNKNISVNINGNALSQVNQIKSSLNGLQTKNISINANGSALSQINSIKSALSGIQTKNISINASGNALGQINSIKSALSGLQSKSIGVNASVNGTAQVNALKASIAGLQGKSVSVSCSTNGIAQVNALTSAIGRVRGKSVSVTANVNGTGAVNALISAINRVKSKSVKISASVSGTGAVQGLASAIAGVRSKSVSVSVTKTVTTVQKSAVASSTPINATPMLMNTPLANIPVFLNATDDIPTVTTSDISPVDVPVSISANNDFGGTIDKNKILPMIDADISNIKELEDALKRLENQLDLIDEKAKNAFGQEKIKLLQQQIPLLREQQKIQEQIVKNEQAQNNELKYWLSQKGFTFDSNGSITNYNDKLLVMEQNVASLKKRYDELNDAKNENETAVKNAQKAYDSANEELSKTKKYLNEYIDANNEMDEATKKWHEYENAIKETQQAIRDAQNKPLENEIDLLASEIDALESRAKMEDDRTRTDTLRQENIFYRQQQDAIKSLVAQMRQQLTEMDEQSDEYKKQREEINKLNKQWWDLEESIKEVNDEIEETNRKMKLFSSNNKLTKLTQEYEKLKNQLDIIDSQMKHAYGTEKIDLMNQSIDVMNQQLEIQRRQIQANEEQLRIYQDELQNFGFQFDRNGDITNYEEVLNANKNSQDLEKMIDLTEEYFDVQSEVRDLTADYADLESAIKDAYEEQLKITKDMEEEITKVYEKEYEKRKKDIEDYTDARIKLLEKEKDAYKTMRDEQDYEKGLREQTDDIEKLRQRIETAKRDTSVAGQKRLQELLEELAKKEEELQEYTQDKIDNDYEANIDNEIDRLKEQEDKLLEALDEKFSEENIAKMVAQAMTSGFIEINGEVKTLQDALLQSIDESAEGYSIIASVVKNELVANLNVALETMRELEDINNRLELQDYGTISPNQVPTVATPNYSGDNNSKTINIGDTHITIEGSVDNEILREVEQMINENNERILREIAMNL